MSEVNPYQAPSTSQSGSEHEPPRPPGEASRLLAVIIAVVGRFPGLGLLMLGRAKLAVPWLVGGLVAYGCWVTLASPRVVVVAFALYLMLWLGALIVTFRAQRGTAPLGLPLWVTAGSLVLAVVALSVATQVFVCEAFQIPASSMMPTLMIGDHIFVRKWQKTPARGDVIVFRYPLSPREDYIKRVMALPGETIEVRDRQVLIDGRPLTQRELAEPCPDERHECKVAEESVGSRSYRVLHSSRRTADFGPVTVAPGHYFVMGDHRDNSNDSRVWGTVAADLVKGVAAVVWWSRDPRDGELRWSRMGTSVR
jgi:signal peptidase I